MITFIKNKLIKYLGGYISPPKDMRGGAINIRNLTKDWTKEELIEHLVNLTMNYQEGHDWFYEYQTTEHELYRLQRILKTEYHTNKDLNRAKHMADLESKVEKLQYQVRDMQEKAQYFNKVLYATGMIVNCTGCWPGRPHGAEYLTEEKVKMMEHLVLRIRVWFNNHQYKLSRDDHNSYYYQKQVAIAKHQDYII